MSVDQRLIYSMYIFRILTYYYEKLYLSLWNHLQYVIRILMFLLEVLLLLVRMVPLNQVIYGFCIQLT